jgi:phosphotransferase system HPr-like phosphotransfer protein
LHAHPAAIFTLTAKKFKSNIRIGNITNRGEWANTKSVLGVQRLCQMQIAVLNLSLRSDNEMI